MKKKDSLGSKFRESHEFIGRQVIDTKGNNCDKIKSIYINPETMSMSGVNIKKGFRVNYFLASDYFDRFSETTLHLNTIPVKPNESNRPYGKEFGKG